MALFVISKWKQRVAWGARATSRVGLTDFPYFLVSCLVVYPVLTSSYAAAGYLSRFLTSDPHFQCLRLSIAAPASVRSRLLLCH